MTRKLTLKSFIPLYLLLFLTGCNNEVTLSDWPQFKKDNYRSGVAEAVIDLSDFGLEWKYDTGQEPIPAWYGPAKEDAFARSGPLPSMRDYDLSYYPIVVGKSLFYGSSADDAVHCHSVSDGAKKWQFTTGAPIRIAPTYYDGKIYVGSDDGYVYCLNAKNGDLLWKFSPTEESEDRLLNNGRFISFYPIRTGVLIEDGIAYFGASLLPWKKSYVCAIDAQTGEVAKEGTYIKEYDNNSMTLEGSMASNGTFLIQPQGRIAPIFLRKESGESAGNLSGTGGCFVLVTPEKNIIHPQTSRNISMKESVVNYEDGNNKQAEFMSYKDGKEIVVKGDSTYVLNDNSLVAYNRSLKKMVWLRRNFQAQRIILVGDFLFAGTSDKVEAISIKNGQTVWDCSIDGTIYALAFANNTLYASTSNGYIYKFSSDGEGGRYIKNNLTKEAVVELRSEKTKHINSDKSLCSSIIQGPYIEPISEDSVKITLTSDKELALSLVWGTNDSKQEFASHQQSKKHTFIAPVRKGFSYDYQIKSEDGRLANYNYDNFFNFFVKEALAIPKADKNAIQLVKSYLVDSKKPIGLSLILGEESDQIALTLASLTEMNVVNIVSSDIKYAKFTETLQDNKSYGRKISALSVGSLNNIPVRSEISDLVWLNEGDKVDADEIIRLISPNQFAVITNLSNNQVWLNNSTLDWQVNIVKSEKGVLVLKKNSLEDVGVWTHQHGDARNASYGGESLFGSTTTTDFEAQWMGRPGARFITDRSGRKPAPLSANGRMFIQGKERITAVNVYNGHQLWVKDIPNLLRMNISHDCSNWACDDEYLYITKDGYLLKIDQLTGDILKHLTMNLHSDTTNNWGYIGVDSNQIIGSTTQKGAQFINYHGGGNSGWYDSQDAPNAHKVLSSRLFSIDKNNGHENWNYVAKGSIINSTIVIEKGKVMFVESHSANNESKSTGRGQNEIFIDTRLVAIDIASGETIYEHKIKTNPGKTVYFMAANSGKTVVVASGDGKYDIVTFDSASGDKVWSTTLDWFAGHHGAHMSKPSIAGDRLVVEPAIYNVHSGERLGLNLPKAGHGCAHFAMTDHAVFYRGGSCTMFDFNANVFSKWERLRPDCWVSTIPAQGMILSPEAGGGCSCGLWYETSIAFAPISRTPIAIIGHTDDSKRDYLDESNGSYSSSCNFDKFKDELKVELKLKPGLQAQIYYTIDGSEPTKESTIYSKNITLTETTNIRAAIYIEKGGKERQFIRSKMFEKR